MGNLKELEERLASDEAFKNELSASKDLNEAFDKIAKAGFSLTEEEVKAIFSTEASSNGQGVMELDDDELDNVSGGVSVRLSPVMAGVRVTGSVLTQILKLTNGNTSPIKQNNTVVGGGSANMDIVMNAYHSSSIRNNQVNANYTGGTSTYIQC